MQRFAIIASVALLVFASRGFASEDPGNAWPDPERFERAIQAFEKADAENPPPQDAVLFVGSSSIRRWHASLAEDFAPLTTIGRGFGGSNTNDLLHFADRIVIQYKPRAIVIYEGDNDIGQGIEKGAILTTYAELLDKIKADLPNCRVYLLSVKPSPLRWSLWLKMQAVNDGLAEIAGERPDVTYIDVASPLLDEDGKPRSELFVKDRLHLNRKGYDAWRETIRPILVEAERKHPTR
jgi:lysophospholipase L1-like esterase